MKTLFLLYFIGTCAYAGNALKDKAHDLLPAPLNTFETHKTTLSEVEKKLGKPDLSEGSDSYWEKDGLKYALKLSFDNKFRLNSIHYTFVSEKPKLEKLGAIDTKKLEPYISSGKVTKYMLLKENNSEVVIDPLNKNIYSVKIP
jgi:hypothetical protein